MMNLAKQYGLSDVGLAKICKKYGISRPPRGYWAMKTAGYNVKRLPLPKGDDVAIEINPNIRSQSVYNREDSLAGMSPHQEVDEEPIVVPRQLPIPHPLTRQSSETLTGLQSNELGLVNPPKSGCLDITVSKDSLRRALPHNGHGH